MLLLLCAACPTVPPRLPVEQLPLLDAAAHRLLHDEAHAALRKEMDAFRAANPWVEQSALFRYGRGGGSCGGEAGRPAQVPPAAGAPCLRGAHDACTCCLPRSVLTEIPELEGLPWWDWPAPLRDADPDTMAK